MSFILNWQNFYTLNHITISSQNSKSNINACRKGKIHMSFISIFVTRRVWADTKSIGWAMCDVGESCVSSEGAGMVGGTPVSLRLWILRISQLPRAVCDLVWVVDSGLFAVPGCLHCELQTSHSSTFHSHSVDSRKVHGCAKSREEWWHQGLQDPDPWILDMTVNF